MGRDSDISEHYRDLKAHYANIKATVGIDCPGCAIIQPKRNPTRLIPGKKCKVCGTTYHQAKSGVTNIAPDRAKDS